MGNINILSTEISNKIAAGEVVERPVSVVKELVENSIDAGSTAITVEIKNGGVSLIRVTDNGSGMTADDAKIAFLRHATSKISTENDLDAIFTLGFRGEALSSIGAVSRVDLYTKKQDEPMGIRVRCYGGEIEACEEAGCPDGTTFEVKDLFFNTPARMKFLKKDSTEGSHISDLITRYILAYPEISFRFISNGKQQLFSPGDNSLKNSVYTVYGRDYANAMVPVDYTIGKLRITGMIGKGNLARPNRNFQSYFVNKRFIKSGLLIKAVEEAYKNQIMVGKYPVAVLNIEVNPALIDINVHPTKLEVKFSEEKAIYELVYYGVKNALYIPDVPKVEIKENNNFKADKGEQVNVNDLSKLIEKQTYQTRFNPFEKKEEQQLVSEKKEQPKIQYEAVTETKKAPEVKADIPKKEEPQNQTVTAPEKKEYTTVQPTEVKADKKNDILSSFRATKKEEPSNIVRQPDNFGEVPKAIPEVVQKPEVKEEPKPEKNFDNVKISGQIFDTYIIASLDEKMLVIDQHAAHERLKFEQLKKSVENKEVFSQMILDPVIVTVSADELDLFERNEEIFENLGFEAEIFGEKQIIVRAAPSDLDCADVDELFIDLLTQLADNKKDVITAKQERFMYTVACKAAIKANHILTADEMKKLVINVLELENINTCPHGRPIMISMTKYELEKQFKRIV